MTTEQKNELQNQLEDIQKNVSNPILICYGGSFAYGTNTDTSDIDIRGIYMDPIEEVLSVLPWVEQYESKEYDSVIYGFKKIIKLLHHAIQTQSKCLDCRTKIICTYRLSVNKYLTTKNIFLSQRATYTFGEYANNQLNRLTNHSSHREETASPFKLAENETRSLENAMNNQYREDENIKDFIAMPQENGHVNINISFQNIDIDKFKAISNTITEIHRNYTKMNSRRNQYAIEHGKVPKHAMHLIRLYMMAIDILEHQKIITYRTGADHELLMDIRRGKDGPFIQNDNITPTQAFEDLLQTYQARMNHAKQVTTLPKEPDTLAIKKLTMDIYNDYYFHK